MPGFHQMILDAAKASGDIPILAAPYPLSDVFCRMLMASGVISGYIAERAPEHVAPAIAGWWIDRNAGVWFTRRRDIAEWTMEHEMGRGAAQ